MSNPSTVNDETGGGRGRMRPDDDKLVSEIEKIIDRMFNELPEKLKDINTKFNVHHSNIHSNNYIIHPKPLHDLAKKFGSNFISINNNQSEIEVSAANLLELKQWSRTSLVKSDYSSILEKIFEILVTYIAQYEQLSTFYLKKVGTLNEQLSQLQGENNTNNNDLINIRNELEANNVAFQNLTVEKNKIQDELEEARNLLQQNEANVRQNNDELSRALSESKANAKIIETMLGQYKQDAYVLIGLLTGQLPMQKVATYKYQTTELQSAVQTIYSQYQQIMLSLEGLPTRGEALPAEIDRAHEMLDGTGSVDFDHFDFSANKIMIENKNILNLTNGNPQENQALNVFKDVDMNANMVSPTIFNATSRDDDLFNILNPDEKTYKKSDFETFPQLLTGVVREVDRLRRIYKLGTNYDMDYMPELMILSATDQLTDFERGLIKMQIKLNSISNSISEKIYEKSTADERRVPSNEQVLKIYQVNTLPFEVSRIAYMTQFSNYFIDVRADEINKNIATIGQLTADNSDVFTKLNETIVSNSTQYLTEYTTLQHEKAAAEQQNAVLVQEHSEFKNSAAQEYSKLQTKFHSLQNQLQDLLAQRNNVTQNECSINYQDDLKRQLENLFPNADNNSNAWLFDANSHPVRVANQPANQNKQSPFMLPLQEPTTENWNKWSSAVSEHIIKLERELAAKKNELNVMLEQNYTTVLNAQLVGSLKNALSLFPDYANGIPLDEQAIQDALSYNRTLVVNLSSLCTNLYKHNDDLFNMLMSGSLVENNYEIVSKQLREISEKYQGMWVTPTPEIISWLTAQLVHYSLELDVANIKLSALGQNAVKLINQQNVDVGDIVNTLLQTTITPIPTIDDIKTSLFSHILRQNPSAENGGNAVEDSSVSAEILNSAIVEKQLLFELITASELLSKNTKNNLTIYDLFRFMVQQFQSELNFLEDLWFVDGNTLTIYNMEEFVKMITNFVPYAAQIGYYAYKIQDQGPYLPEFMKRYSNYCASKKVVSVFPVNLIAIMTEIIEKTEGPTTKFWTSDFAKVALEQQQNNFRQELNKGRNQLETESAALTYIDEVRTTLASLTKAANEAASERVALQNDAVRLQISNANATAILQLDQHRVELEKQINVREKNVSDREQNASIKESTMALEQERDNTKAKFDLEKTEMTKKLDQKEAELTSLQRETNQLREAIKLIQNAQINNTNLTVESPAYEVTPKVSDEMVAFAANLINEVRQMKKNMTQDMEKFKRHIYDVLINHKGEWDFFQKLNSATIMLMQKVDALHAEVKANPLPLLRIENDDMQDASEECVKPANFNSTTPPTDYDIHATTGVLYCYYASDREARMEEMFKKGEVVQMSKDNFVTQGHIHYICCKKHFRELQQFYRFKIDKYEFNKGGSGLYHVDVTYGF